MSRLVPAAALVVVALVAAVAVAARRARRGWLAEHRWYEVVYRAFYVLGLRVWERQRSPADLIRLVEGPMARPPGRALDLGCGSGTDSVYLAQHGWTVTGVDIVPEALALARGRAAAAGVTPTFVEGDVTRLADLGVHGPFDLVLDFGCLHTLPSDRRDAYVRSVGAVARPGALLLLYGFARPPRLAPMQAGLTEPEVRERFTSAGWDLVSADRVADDPIVVARARVDRSFELWRFRLHRRAQDSAQGLDVAARSV
jgi:SAM-dependent methyltransferase